IHAAALDSVPGKSNGGDQWSPYERFSTGLWEEELRSNLTSAQIVTQAVAPVMMQQKSGSIIFIASDLALIGPQNSIYDPGKFKDIAYITSKAGILGLMRSWAAYLGPYNVRANAIAPGGMYRNHPEDFVKKNSALNMLGRMARLGEYNGPIVFLAADASSYMTGACLVVDGGRTAW
ncbi:MAG: SDR family oxidoreductase, partial [Patescibacteria group bacterium]